MTAIALVAALAVMDFPGTFLLVRLEGYIDRRAVAPAAFLLCAALLLGLSGAMTLPAWLCAVALAVLRAALDAAWGHRAAECAGWFLARQAMYIALALVLTALIVGGHDARSLIAWCGHCLHALAGRDMTGSIPALAALMMALWLLLWLTAGSGTLIGLTLTTLRQREPVAATDADAGEPVGLDPRMGLFIGWAERVLTLLLIMAGAYTGLGVLVSVKTAARFPEFKSRAFAEYYILGTLLSLLCGIVLSALLVGLLDSV